MASRVTSVDVSDVLDGLDGMLEMLPNLCRSMAVAGGQVIRDEAKVRAPVGTEEGGSLYPGALQDAIYLAYRDGVSTFTRQIYSVTWNSKKAPHGHLLEFGHWQPYKVAKIPGGYGGGWYTTKERLPSPKWTPAYPFLRPAYEATRERSAQAMFDRGRERLPELLEEAKA